MQLVHYPYSLCNADVVTLADGQPAAFVRRAVEACHGLIMLSGKSEIVETTAADTGRVFTPADGLTSGALPSDITVVATGTTSWLCLSDNGTGARQLNLLTVDVGATLPQGWAFISVDAPITADGVLVPQFALFRARDYEVPLLGNGRVILLK